MITCNSRNSSNTGNIRNSGNSSNPEKENRVAELVEEVERKGFFLSFDGSLLRVKPSGIPEDLRNKVQERKEEVISFLSSRSKTFPDVVSVALGLVSFLPSDDADSRHLEALINSATDPAATSQDHARLSFEVVEVFARRIDQGYRAAIWGGRTWREITIERNRIR